jgi:hypothetical protein
MMANLLGSYSPNDINIIIGGVPVSGFGDGDFVSAEFSTDAAVLKEGADGSPAISYKRGLRGGQVTVTLLQTSLSNNYLSGLLFAQKYGAGASTTIPIAVTNSQGGQVVTMPHAAFMKEPTVTYSAEVGTVEYTFIGQLSVEYAGNEV